MVAGNEWTVKAKVPDEKFEQKTYKKRNKN